MSREEAVARFLAAAGWAGCTRRLLAADASFRRYDRIAQDARTAVLMDAPPPMEDVRPFVAVARHLRDLGLSAPRVEAVDETAGFVLLEDFGDDTYARLLAAGAAEEPLYALAVDLLASLHRHPAAARIDLPAYDEERLLAEALLLTDWYLPAVLRRPTDAGARNAYAEAWRAVLPGARGVPETLVLRDYHVDNLMLLPGRDGPAGCGLLDFQDAVIGPCSYDFVSLVEDARRDLAPGLAARMERRYLSVMPSVEPEAFRRSCAVLGAQRHAKVIGIFTRLAHRDGKPAYLANVPRVWRLLDRSLAHPALAPVQDWFAEHVPPTERRVPQAGRALAAAG